MFTSKSHLTLQEPQQQLVLGTSHLAGHLHLHRTPSKQRRWRRGRGLWGRRPALEGFGGCVLTAVEESSHFQLKLNGVHVSEEYIHTVE